MATSTYSLIDTAISLVQEIANENRPVTISGQDINQTPGLPATVKVDGVDAHYFAAPTQIVTPGTPILLFLSPDFAAANDNPVNDNDALAARLAPRLPERMRAKLTPRPNRAKLKVAHTHTPPKPTISVATPYVQPQIKRIEDKIARETYHALKSNVNASECEIAPQPAPAGHRIKAEDLERLNDMKLAQARRTFEHMALFAIKLLAPAPAA